MAVDGWAVTFGTNVTAYPSPINGQCTNFVSFNVALHCESKKLDRFSFEHNFRKHCPILIILSPL